ncbi:MAG TPA: DUF6544 family protein [Longimicrobium sp.]|jgi:hypothetical protein
MNRPLRITAAVAVGLAATLAGTIAAGTLLWNRATAREVARLGSSQPHATVYSPEQLEGLPAPVARYFRTALRPGQPLIRTARFRQEGHFWLGARDGRWSPFTAEETFSTSPPAFVWDASIRMAPLLSARVRDSYAGGTGSMRARLASVIPLVDQSGGPELAAGALLRYLGEAVWLPTALLPASGVAWTPIDDRTSRATITDRGVTVSLDFTFGENGEIRSTYTPTRSREVEGRWVPTPWNGSYRRYERVAGMLVPMEGEVAWVLPDGPLPYWRGRITGAEYDLGEQPGRPSERMERTSRLGLASVETTARRRGSSP